MSFSILLHMYVPNYYMHFTEETGLKPSSSRNPLLYRRVFELLGVSVLSPQGLCLSSQIT